MITPGIISVLVVTLASQGPVQIEEEAAAADPTAPDVSPEAAPPAVPVPEMLRPLVDSAGILPEDVDEDLSRKLHAHRQASGVSVGVLIVDSLAGLGTTSLGDASAAAARRFVSGWARDTAWVLVFLSVQDRKLRIEGDERLKASFTDDDALRLTTEATRSFRAGDLPAGLRVLVEGIIAETPEAPASGEEQVFVFLLAAGMALAFVGGVAWLRRRQPKPAAAPSPHPPG